ncbi:A/G-specific adenine glycosylase [Corynebacterium heidelbergense]|uniref:Adenine DNA glycosylase n=1 Tax=Corynebacterium heidelbergense TaxID=2055947 RepID=A0A364VED1_9CORY|nr:A/G-specific adenine glycosylase [Corynebacterium heidelbergense]RAV34971.1 DNA glycosylase [Corynebacterium heidelbergense]WCZ35895.1 A/G-specific adenine glycosylase [Corynebacterium heidelbergense]
MHSNYTPNRGRVTATDVTAHPASQNPAHGAKSDPFPLVTPSNRWFARHGRPLPWRDSGTSPWGVLVSEVMSQQTPVARVEPLWRAWLDRWPEPKDLAQATPADVLRMWANLGYPRRALRLRECAQAIVDRHAGAVPGTVSELHALPGVGSYTARAVAAFHFGLPVPVVDTNVRRVHRRAVEGVFLPGPARAGDLAAVADMMPFVAGDPDLERRGYANAQQDPARREDAVLFTAAIMELGALVCTARSPRCEQCPVQHVCEWVRRGKPLPTESEVASARARVQRFEGTDRQVRGKIMRLLRESADGAATAAEVDLVWPDAAQLSRSLSSLVADGLVVRDGILGDATTYRLPH